MPQVHNIINIWPITFICERGILVRFISLTSNLELDKIHRVPLLNVSKFYKAALTIKFKRILPQNRLQFKTYQRLGVGQNNFELVGCWFDTRIDPRPSFERIEFGGSTRHWVGNCKVIYFRFAAIYPYLFTMLTTALHCTVGFRYNDD